MTTRRAFVAGAASLAVPTAPAVAAAPPETSHDRVRRLCNELSDALSDCYEGQFAAEIMPRCIEPQWAVHLFDIDCREEVRQRHRLILTHVEALCEARREVDRLAEIARTQHTPSGVGRQSLEWFHCLDAERVASDALAALVRVVG